MNSQDADIIDNSNGSYCKEYSRSKSLNDVKFGPKALITPNENNVLSITDTRYQRLTWSTKPLSVLVIRKIYDLSIIPKFVDLVEWLLKVKKMVVFVEAKIYEDTDISSRDDFQTVSNHLMRFREGQDDITDRIDFVICLGGDGTLVHVSGLFQMSAPPVISFHLGSCKFLSPFDFEERVAAISTVLEGNAPMILRTRLKCYICPKDADSRPCIKNKESKDHTMVLNDVVIKNDPNLQLCNLDLFIDGTLITKIQGDGLIVSTSTGSTAYSAAAGSSMVHPSVPAMIITPVCPHSLSFRPIVVPCGVEIQISVSPDARGTAFVCFDGINRTELEKDDVLQISTSKFPFPSICKKDQITDWFYSLSTGLRWNAREKQKVLN